MAQSSPEIHVDYEPETDVVFVTFGEGEPAYGIEIGDEAVVKIGYQSQKVVGFELLQPQKFGIMRLYFDFDDGLKGIIAKRETLDISIDIVMEQVREAFLKIEEKISAAAS